MKNKTVILLVFFVVTEFVFTGLVSAQTAPDWVSSLPPSKDGLIFFRGFSEGMYDQSLTTLRANSNAQTELGRLIQSGDIPVPYPIPADAKSRSTFANFFNGMKVEGEISDFKTVETWMDADGGVYVLCSCSGVELKIDTPLSMIEKIANMSSDEIRNSSPEDILFYLDIVRKYIEEEESAAE